MSDSYFSATAPERLTTDERREWARRCRTAQNTLEIQQLGGTQPNPETIACFQRYVRGEISLSVAIERVREQIAQEHAVFRASINRRNND